MIYFAEKRVLCIQGWCSTKVDNEGNHIPGPNNVRLCGPRCPLKDDVWTADDTLIFSQHYDEKERLKVLTKLNILGWLKPSLNSKATERSGLCLYSGPTPTDFLRFAGPNPT